MKRKILHRNLLIILSISLSTAIIFGIVSAINISANMIGIDIKGFMHTQEITEPVESIIIDGERLFPNINVQVSETNTIKLTAAHQKVDVSVKDKQLIIKRSDLLTEEQKFNFFRDNYPDLFGNGDDITIEVPRILKNITFKNNVGSVKMAKLNLETLRVESVGIVDLLNMNITEKISINSAVGNVYLKNITGNTKVIDITTNVGEIHMAHIKNNNIMTLKSDVGAINLYDITGNPFVNAATNVGDITVTDSKVDDKSIFKKSVKQDN